MKVQFSTTSSLQHNNLHHCATMQGKNNTLLRCEASITIQKLIYQAISLSAEFIRCHTYFVHFYTEM